MKTFLYLILIIIFFTELSYSTPQVQAGIFNQGSDLIIKARSNENITTGFMPAAIITIKYLTSYNIDVSAPVSIYGLQLYQTLSNGNYTYKIFQTTSGTQNYNWNANAEYEILRVTVSGGIGNGNFEIANDQFITSQNGLWYIEHNVFGDITNYTLPLYQQNVSGVPLPVISSNPELPEYFDISQNYPNPFNPVTNIKFQLPHYSKVTIKIYDVLGKEISRIVNGDFRAGYYTVNFDAGTISSGIYYYRIVAASDNRNFTATKKMLLIK